MSINYQKNFQLQIRLVFKIIEPAHELNKILIFAAALVDGVIIIINIWVNDAIQPIIVITVAIIITIINFYVLE